MPGRKYPGIVIMGDTLASITFDVERALLLLKSEPKLGKRLEVDRLGYALQRLNEHLALYEQVLQEEGISLPYVKDDNI